MSINILHGGPTHHGCTVPAPRRQATDVVVPDAGRMPAITVVTPALNAARHMRAAIESIAGATARAFEHLIVDGGSTDGTRAIAGGGASRLIDMPGSDSHEAINAGFAAARGDYVAVLNADDRFLPGALDRQIAWIERDGGAFSACRSLLDNADGSPPALLDPVGPADWSDVLCYGAPGFNGFVFSRGLLARFGPLDPSYRMAADREFLLRLRAAGLRPATGPEPGYVYLRHDASRTLDPAARNRTPILHDHIRLSAAYATRPEIDPALRARMRRWHSFEVAVAAKCGALSVRELIGAFLTDPAWPARAFAGRRERQRIADAFARGA